MAVTAQMVKELREMTGAGMMDCKKALTETNGDIEKAVDYLRENGMAKAAKKAGRIAAEGISFVTLSADWKYAVAVEVNSETDFVAKNAEFKTFVEDVANHILASSAKDVEALLAEPWAKDNSNTVEQALASKIATIGENLKIRRFEKIESAGAVAAYDHMNGKIGVLVNAEADGANAKVITVLKDVAMQVAALNPKYVSRDEVDQDYIAHETEVLKTQARLENPGKPENIIEQMVKGRLAKELREICLLDQAFVKDGDLTVAQYLEKMSKELGSNITVKNFVRFETGEGLEKKQENFADEVAKQMGM
ncbi:elongation factor Ts [Clostridiales bacterium COT073_COT-073]|nr:elongation factor Ts [Clostridiales bacterium COT073_COT-073]